MKKIIMILTLILAITLAACFDGKPDLVKQYDYLTAKLHESNEQEFENKYINENFSYTLVKTNDENDSVKIFKNHIFEYEYTFDAINIIAIDDVIEKNGVLYFYIMYSNIDSEVFHSIYAYQDLNLSRKVTILKKENTIIEDIILKDKIYIIESNYEYTYQMIKVYNYDFILIDMMMFEGLSIFDVIYDNGYIFFSDIATGVNIYSYKDLKLTKIGQTFITFPEKIEYDEKNNYINFIGYELTYELSKAKKLTYYEYNNGEEVTLFEIDFPTDYIYNPQKAVIFEEAILIPVKINNDAAKSSFGNVMIIHFDYKDVKSIYIKGNFHGVIGKKDYIYLYEDKIDFYSKEDLTTYKKINIKEILS